ncbi:MAG: metallophosphoesterase [Clostridia bacterium]|nr:metallophosphoesterase [Clostridia bacterium]
MDKLVFNKTTAEPITFRNGKLRIIHITDTHIGSDNEEMTLCLIAQALDREKPDVAVVTGDNVSSDSGKDELLARTRRFMQVFQDRNIPVALTFGNHDSETGIVTRQELMACYNEFPCSISVDEGDIMEGCGTYNVPVLASGSDEVRFNLWIFDSGDYDDEGKYANVTEEKIEWYKEKSREYENMYGKKVYSLAFQHIIVPEVYDALKNVSRMTPYTYKGIYDHDGYYRFNPEMHNFGVLKEPPCCGAINHGQFDAIVERGDCLAVFSGHDHTNAFGVKYKGVDIVNSLSTRYQDDCFSTQYGYRIIDVDENNTSVYTSKVVHWYNIYKPENLLQYKNKGDLVYKTAASVALKGLRERFLNGSGHLIVRVFGLRKVKYKD